MSVHAKSDEEFVETDNTNTELYVPYKDDNLNEVELNPFLPSSSKSTKKKDRTNILWKLVKDYSVRKIPQWKRQMGDVVDIPSPIEYCRDSFDDTFLTKVNLYSSPININKALQLTQAELEQFIAKLLIMGFQNLRRIRIYWSSDFSAGKEIRESFSRDKCENIKRCLQVVNN
ncbi:unnamed protein product [Lepeophtheirus salmonis]|uniref:(salmon louse) hypothetical protein n=1 Tax=Lepeophtheirus salmonis TaxID=72036 RepID=A0A7R8H0F5_LEPSM|nr:unnamed protein product [Lepeophtheirus salmonis]CAF2783326.1 unnamed protein product [Lepeophtheirus salmonis]